MIFLLLLTFSLSGYACVGESVLLKEQDFQTEVVEYLPPGPSAKKVVLIIPPTGGMNFIDKSYAEDLCEEGIAAVIVKNWSGDDEYNLELAIHTRFYQRGQKAIRIAMNHYPDVELGILGTSVGGLHASIAASLHERIKSAFLIVAGGNIDYIIARSTQNVLVEAKKKRLKLFGFPGVDAYQKALKKVLPYEPLEMKVSSEKKFGMILSTNDDVVPTISQVKLAELWKPVYKSDFWLGHKATVVATWLFYSDDVVEFFSR